VAGQRHGRGVLGRAVLALERPKRKPKLYVNSDKILKLSYFTYCFLCGILVS
jgi:hypothetical protein